MKIIDALLAGLELMISPMGLLMWIALGLLLLVGCASWDQAADCTAAQRDGGKTLMCCSVGMAPGNSVPQWRCAWVHKVLSG